MLNVFFLIVYLFISFFFNVFILENEEKEALKDGFKNALEYVEQCTYL